MDFFQDEHQNANYDAHYDVMDNVQSWKRMFDKRFPNPPKTARAAQAGLGLCETPAHVLSEMLRWEFTASGIMKRETEFAINYYEKLSWQSRDAVAAISLLIRHAVPYWVASEILVQFKEAAFDGIAPPKPHPWPFPLIWMTSRDRVLQVGHTDSMDGLPANPRDRKPTATSFDVDGIMLVQNPEDPEQFQAICAGSRDNKSIEFHRSVSQQDDVFTNLVLHFLHFIDGAVFKPLGRTVSESRAREVSKYRRQVHWIDLRRIKRERTDEDRSAEHQIIEWQNRWAVMGHWRRQACGEDHAERKRIWIAPHVKGPLDKPMKPRAYRVIR